MPYRLRPQEIGILVEFYLPKKVSYQGPLHDRLKDALYIDRVKTLLRERKEEILPIVEALLNRRGLNKDDWEKIIKSIPENMLGGWSMYEVDGVFIDRDKHRLVHEQQRKEGKELTNVINNEDTAIYEERTQVVRLILYPDLVKLRSAAGNECSSDAARGLIEAFIGHPMVRSGDFFKVYGTLWQKQFGAREALEQACQYMEEWLTAAAAFVFGYLIWSVSEAIGTKEKVFWVTSTWGLKIHQVELDQIPVNKSLFGL